MELIKSIPSNLSSDVIQAAVKLQGPNTSKNRNLEDIIMDAWIHIYGENDPVQMICNDRCLSEKREILKTIERLPINDRERLCRIVGPLVPYLRSIWDIDQLFRIVQEDLNADWDCIIEAMVCFGAELDRVELGLIRKIKLLPAHLTGLLTKLCRL